MTSLFVITSEESARKANTLSTRSDFIFTVLYLSQWEWFASLFPFILFPFALFLFLCILFLSVCFVCCFCFHNLLNFTSISLTMPDSLYVKHIYTFLLLFINCFRIVRGMCDITITIIIIINENNHHNKCRWYRT